MITLTLHQPRPLQVSPVVGSCPLSEPFSTAGGEDGVLSVSNPVLQQRKHIAQGGFWGDLQTVYQRGWSGTLTDKEQKWHD